MSITAPWADDTPQLLATGHGHALTVRAVGPALPTPVELAVTACRFGWDRRRAPRFTGRVTVAAPDEGTLYGLDPRRLTRLELDAGYIRPGGGRDVHTLARPLIADRSTARPGNVVDLELAGDEQLVIDNAPLGVFVPSQASCGAAIRDTLAAALPYAPSYGTDALPAGVPADLVSLTEGGDYWQLVEDLADRVDGDVWHDGLDDWHLTPRPATVAEAAAVLRTGPGGTITDASTALTRRGGWANAVLLTYTFQRSGADVTVYGNAWASGGPYDVGTVGQVVLQDSRTTPTTVAEAHKAAAAILRRRLAAGRTVQVTALAAYWLRPGHTATVQLPVGAQERLLVEAVSFRPLDGLMDVEFRQPDDVTTITTGG